MTVCCISKTITGHVLANLLEKTRKLYFQLKFLILEFFLFIVNIGTILGQKSKNFMNNFNNLMRRKIGAFEIQVTFLVFGKEP